MISAKNISFHYRGGRNVLNQVGFDLEDGRFLAILGNNGAGKSTLLKCLNRILRADSGSFRMDDEEILTLSHREIARRIAFVAQSVPNTQMTVHDAVMLGRRPYMGFGVTENDHKIVHEAMHALGLEDMRGRYLNELSGGERQKVMLARAMAQQPKLLLLDEPTSSLDIMNQYQVLQIAQDFCRKEGKSAIVVIHDLNLALRFCDRFLLLRGGSVYRYGDRSCMDAQALREVYGVDGKFVMVENQMMIYVNENPKGELEL